MHPIPKSNYIIIVYEFDYIFIYSSFIIIGLEPIFPNPCLLSFVLLMEILQSITILHFQITIVVPLTPTTKIILQLDVLQHLYYNLQLV
jgi:hypothetical protein